MALVIVVVVATVVIGVALVAWFFAGQNPAQGEGGAPVQQDTTSDRFYHRADRPAGPDAEEPLAPPTTE